MEVLRVARAYLRRAKPGFINEQHYLIVFKNNSMLAVTADHAFKVVRRKKTSWLDHETLYLPAFKLRRGDEIFVDVQAFKKDGKFKP